MAKDTDDDKPKRSWRDIDKNKDRSKHRQEDRKPISSPQKAARAASASKVYRSQLDAFFEGAGKAPAKVKDQLEKLTDVSPQGAERMQALRAIKDAGTSAETMRAVSAFLGQWELPLDYDVLSQVLTSADENHVSQALTMLGQMFEHKRAPKHIQVLEQRLRRVKNLADDPQLQKEADLLLKQLRIF